MSIRQVGPFKVDLPDAEHTFPGPHIPKKNVDLPLARRPGNSEGPPVPPLAHGHESKKPVKQCNSTPAPVKPALTKSHTPIVPKRKDGPGVVNPIVEKTPPPPETYVRGVEKSRNSVYHPSTPAIKKPPTHLPHTPSNEDKTVVPMEQRPGYVKPVVEQKPEIKRGISRDKPAENVYPPLPPKRKKKTRVAIQKKRQDLPIEYRAGGALHPDTLNPPPTPEPKTLGRGLDTSGKTKNSVCNSHPAIRRVPPSSKVMPSNEKGKRHMPGYAPSPPPPPPPAATAPAPRGLQPSEKWRYSGRTDPQPEAPRMLTFDEFAGPEYALLQAVTRFLKQARKGIGVSVVPVAQLPPSALTPEGIVYDGRVYAIGSDLRQRFQPNENYLIPGPWNVEQFHVWYTATRKSYDEYVLGYTET